MNGILVLNKPPGPTSFDMVRLVRKLTGLRRVGHGGTLDPAASGVLPVLLGQATRVNDVLHELTKAYRATIRLGVTTDTYDAQGRIVREVDAAYLKLGDVHAALQRFAGEVWQKPPMHSALKRQGRPLYKLARAGIEVEREPRKVRIESIEIVAWEPPCMTIDVTCGAGTYIRSIAHDLGQALGCGAHLQALQRTRAGPFTIQDALSVESLYDAAQGGYLEEQVYAPDWALLHLPAAIVDETDVEALRFGRTIVMDAMVHLPQAERACRAYSDDGQLVGLVQLDPAGGRLKPAKVFAANHGSAPPAQEEHKPDTEASLTDLLP